MTFWACQNPRVTWNHFLIFLLKISEPIFLSIPDFVVGIPVFLLNALFALVIPIALLREKLNPEIFVLLII